MRVPNRGDISAIELVKKFNDKIIAVINMVHTLGEVNKEQSLHRINLWNETFSKCGIRTRINYDFYWDSPLKLIKLYKSIYEFISNDSKEAFALKISKIEKKYARDCQEISSAIHTTIINCQKINYEIVIDDSKDEQMKKNKMNNALEKIQNEIVYYLQPVLQKIEEVYQIQGNNSYDNDDVNAESKILQSSFSKKTEQVTGGVMVGGAFGVYGVLKAIALGSAFASAAPIILGSAIIGGIWALFSKGENATELINVHLDNNQLTNILKRTIGILRVSSNQGFGKNSKLDEEVLESIIENKIDDLFNKYEIESIRDVSHEKLNKQINSIVFDICEM
ncbi:MAG: hypothetical protein KDC52_02410 [Ignavibacteriae bacterium]|nr:hypothetical protein [Ignavibacteriota bacterium]